MNAAVNSAVRVSVTIRRGESLKTYELAAGNGILTIGRDMHCSVSLKTELASRHHAMLDVRGHLMSVRDTSTHGTYVGGSLIRQNTVHVPYETPLCIGEYILIVGLSRAKEHRPAAALPAMQLVPAAASAASPMPSMAMAMAPATAPGSAPEAAKPAHRVAPPDERHPDQPWGDSEVRAKEVALRSEIHKKLLEQLDLSAISGNHGDDPGLRSKVLIALRQIVNQLGDRIPPTINQDELIGALVDEALGLGPLERFLSDPTVNEIMVVDPNTIYVEQHGKLTRADARFTDDERVRAAIERIVTPLGRRIDESVPLVDARLADGSRVNAVIRPLALRGSAITIRKFSRTPLTLEKLIGFGAMNERMARFLTRSVTAKKNIVIAGGTGSGKTTLLNALSGAIPSDERIVTIEDAAELQLKQPHVVSLETRPANLEGKGEYTIRELVKNALRMRPDRIVVGECRGGEALDMLQAMNTGHDGSLTTTHANSPREAIARLETLVLMAGLELPIRAIREQIAGSVQLLVQQSRLADGSRRVTSITEVSGIGDDGEIELVPIFEYVRTGTGPKGKVLGEFRATGFLPSYLNDFLIMDLIAEGEDYL